MHVPSTVAVRLPIASDMDLTWIRQYVRQVTAELGFGLVQQTKLVTAASELARNALVHGGGGEMEVQRIVRGRRRGLRLVFSDSGPGIADTELAMSDGYTSGGGLGLGLGGARRLVHEFAIDSRPGQGTTVAITAWDSRPPSPRKAV